jgi:hypothetical protein
VKNYICNIYNNFFFISSEIEASGSGQKRMRLQDQQDICKAEINEIHKVNALRSKCVESLNKELSNTSCNLKFNDENVFVEIIDGVPKVSVKCVLCPTSGKPISLSKNQNKNFSGSLFNFTRHLNSSHIKKKPQKGLRSVASMFSTIDDQTNNESTSKNAENEGNVETDESDSSQSTQSKQSKEASKNSTGKFKTKYTQEDFDFM